MSKTSITPVLYSRKDKSGLYPIKIRITKDRKSQFENIGFSVTKSHWLKSTLRVSTTHPSHNEINFEIDKKLKEFENENQKFGKVQISRKLNVFEDFKRKIETFKEIGRAHV